MIDFKAIYPLSEGRYHYGFTRKSNPCTSYYVKMYDMSLTNSGPLPAPRFTVTTNSTKDSWVDFSLMVPPIKPKFHHSSPLLFLYIV